MLNKISEYYQGAKNVIYPLRPIQSITQIAMGALSIVSVPFTGTFGVVNGVSGLSSGAIGATKDLTAAGGTIATLAQAKPVAKSQVAHLVITTGVVAAVTFVAFNPIAALVAAKTGALVFSKTILAGLCII